MGYKIIAIKPDGRLCWIRENRSRGFSRSAYVVGSDFVAVEFETFEKAAAVVEDLKRDARGMSFHIVISVIS